MRTLKLTIAYDGTNYVGWQVQPNGMTVQERLERAWTEITGEKIRITASGRTDSGVHALAQICGLTTGTDISCERLAFALTSTTPEDISVLKVEPAEQGFDPIRDATSKTYRYTVQSGPILDVHGRKYRWHVPYRMDAEKMEQAAAILRGKHDFQSFEAKGAERLTTVRTITRLDIVRREDPVHGFVYFDFYIASSGFLYNMVRIIVGTLVHVGTGRKPPEWVREVLEKKERTAAGQTAPAAGLILLNVCYDL